MFVLPYWPGAYAVLRQKCPLWENYALQPRGPEFQRRQIAEIETAAPAVVVLQDFALDGREELRFRNTHPLLNQFIHERFRPLGELGAPPNIEVLVPRRSHSP